MMASSALRLASPGLYPDSCEISAKAFCHACKALLRPAASSAPPVGIESRSRTQGFRDNGVGMDPAVADKGKEGHYGLHGMRERANGGLGPMETEQARLVSNIPQLNQARNRNHPLGEAGARCRQSEAKRWKKLLTYNLSTLDTDVLIRSIIFPAEMF